MKKFLNSIPYVLIIIVAASLLLACDNEKDKIVDPNKPKISLNKESLTLEVGSSERLEATFTPDNTENKAHTWKSSDSKIATVDETGKIEAVGVGTCTITVRALDGGSTDNCQVAVVEKIVNVTGISLNRTSANVVEGDTIHLIPSVRPVNATDQTVIWATSDENYATVDENGVVTGIKEGSATITATTNDGNKKATCKVTVDYNGVKVTSISLNRTSAEVIEGDTIHLTPIFNPQNATNRNILWKSDNEEYVTVDSLGVVTAKKEGSANITATTEQGGKKATCKINVKFRGVRFSKIQLSGVTFMSATLTGNIEISGVNVKEKGIIYKYSDNEQKITSKNNNIDITIDNLNKCTEYEARLFVTTEDRTEYSEMVKFKTLDVLKTNFKETDVYRDAIKITSPVCDGYGWVGVCYGTDEHPTVTSNTTNIFAENTSSGDKVYKGEISNLSPGTKYYLRTYQKIGNQIIYSDDEVSFVTIGNIGQESIITYKCTNITNTPWWDWYRDGEGTKDFEATIVFDYKITDGLYSVSTSSNCSFIGNTIGFLGDGAGKFNLKRKFRARNYSDSITFVNMTKQYVYLTNIETGVVYHCALTGYCLEIGTTGLVGYNPHRHTYCE